MQITVLILVLGVIFIQANAGGGSKGVPSTSSDQHVEEEIVDEEGSCLVNIHGEELLIGNGEEVNEGCTALICENGFTIQEEKGCRVYGDQSGCYAVSDTWVDDNGQQMMCVQQGQSYVPEPVPEGVEKVEKQLEAEEAVAVREGNEEAKVAKLSEELNTEKEMQNQKTA